MEKPPAKVSIASLAMSEGDITGEQRQVVADALDWSQIMNSEFTGDICHQFNQVTPRIIPGDLSASHRTAAAEARTEARFSRS